MVHRTSVAFAFFVLALAGCSDKQVFFPTPTESPKPRPVPAASDYTPVSYTHLTLPTILRV